MFKKTPPTLDTILSQFVTLENQLFEFTEDAIDEEKEIQAQIDALMVARENKQAEIQKADRVRQNIVALTQ